MQHARAKRPTGSFRADRSDYSGFFPTFARDLAMLVGFGTQLWMYASPIAYDMFRFTAFAPGGKWHALYMCNPISPIVNLFRYAYLGTGAIEWKYYFIGWGITLALLFIGIVLFSRVEKTFMDTV